MAIKLGTMLFDTRYTTAKELYEEVAGRDERRVELSGVIANAGTVAAIETQLDAMLAEASAEDYSTALVLRPGRRLWVRRLAFDREIAPDQLTGSFKLTLGARDPFEESEEAQSIAWAVSESGATLELASAGNAGAPLRIEMIPSSTLVSFVFSDGNRTLSCPGTFPAGTAIVVDGVQRRVTKDGVDITPYTEGVFPEASPGGNVLMYTDGDTSGHAAQATVSYRDRWW